MPKILPGKRPSNLGASNGQLRDCSKKPNCCSSEASDSSKQIARLSDNGDPKAAIAKLAGIVKATERTEIIEQTDDYLYAEFSTPTMGFTDDVEFYAANGEIQLRSASRVGYSDWGVNRKRLNTIVAAYNA